MANPAETRKNIPPQLSEAGTYVLDTFKAELTPPTASAYMYDIRRIAKELGGDPLTWKVADILEVLDDPEFSDASRLRKMSSLRQVDQILSSRYPDRELWNLLLPNIQTPLRPLKPLSGVELESLLSVTRSNVRDHALVTTGFMTGLTSGQIVGLNWDAFTIAGAQDVTVRYPSGFEHPFQNREAKAITDLYDAANVANDREGLPVFTNRYDCRLERQSVNYILNGCKILMNGEGVPIDDLSPERLRDTYVERFNPTVEQLSQRWGVQRQAAKKWIGRRDLYRGTRT